MARGPAVALLRACTRKRNAYGRAKASIFNRIFPELSPAGVEVGAADFTRSLCNFNCKGRSFQHVSSIFDAGKFSARLISSQSESGEESSNVKDECGAPEFDYNVDAASLGADGVCDERDGWKKAASAVIEKEPDEDVWNDDFEDVVESDEGSVDFEKAELLDPVELYKEMISSESGSNKTRQEWDVMVEVFKYFVNSGWASNQALAIYIGKSFFPTAVSKFRAFFMRRCPRDVYKYLVSLGPGEDAEKYIFPIFVEFCMEEFPDEIKRFRNMVESADLTKPHTWFPFARAMKRKIIYHCGPTNSGKTYNALQRFMEAKKAIYCSPLRLLAMEVFDKVNAQGVYCSLLTGQEKKFVPFSNHVACTVEMLSTDEMYDVAIIDEIQMMADPYRGHAWTRALLGLKADEIHLCGDPSVLDVVRMICSETGDDLVVNQYGRFKPLVVEAKTLLGDLKNVRSGDCVVAFSRREIFEVRVAIEKHTNHRCCVIYGALPPETRRQQASLFNDQDNEFDVLVATDAVGMGLNLNIRRVVFYGLSKYNGDKIVPVAASQVKQIAGRAGRRGSIYPDGLTTTLHLEDLDYLIECLQQPFDTVKKVGLFPSFEQVELFAGRSPYSSFSQLLDMFGESCRLDGSYFLCRHDNVKKVANMLEKFQGLSLEDRFNFCFAPVNIRDPKAMHHLMRFAAAFSDKLPVGLAMGMPTRHAGNDTELLELETKHQVLSMYLWLSNQFDNDTFPHVKRAETMATDIAELLGESLTKARWKLEPKKADKQKTKQKEAGEKKKEHYERPKSLIKLRKEGKTNSDSSDLQEVSRELLTSKKNAAA
uniref:RNA helicase n=2 Tax=Kalanchoe fedtschenkoi TaxID=63787 RepID=A0A7N0UCD5_KALFE